MIPPAKTGSDSSKRIAVISIAQIKRGILLKFIVLNLMLMIVTIKLIAPRSEERPAKCNDKQTQSTALPECAIAADKGG